MKNTVKTFTTGTGIEISSKKTKVCRDAHKKYILNEINTCMGAYFCSSFEYPGRYTRWDMGFVNPPIEIRTFGRMFVIRCLNKRGQVLLNLINTVLADKDFIENFHKSEDEISGSIINSSQTFTEEERSRQPSVFLLIRLIREAFRNNTDSFLGLYGAFGFDLIFQFEDIELNRKRYDDQADMVLFIPDEIFIIDHRVNESFLISYEFSYSGLKTNNIKRTKSYDKITTKKSIQIPNQNKGDYAQKVLLAKEYFKRGDVFEVVPSHNISTICDTPSSILFEKLTQLNPSPYGFMINIGEQKLIGASPEMYIRSDGNRIETCPISGTIRRGRNAIEDAERIKELLNSVKDECELTMCTDVDRNDKSRICEPDSVNVIGRRQIEMYSHLIHTVDHVEGRLLPQFDSLDAFMTHMWAVTVTGSPKKAALKWIEKYEDSNREWYGGAVGLIGFDGNINTGLTLRTIQLKDGYANVRVGATLLYDSIPEAEEEETYVKAAALMKIINDCQKEYIKTNTPEIDSSKTNNSEENNSTTADSKTHHSETDPDYSGITVLFVDHEDSFVHTLSGYFKKTGARIKTLRHNLARNVLKNESFDLVVLSPGPGNPSEFCLNDTIQLCIEKSIPIFGVCLGLQGIIEYFGGELAILDNPMHGKQSRLQVLRNNNLLHGIENNIKIGRYHSLYAKIVPDEILITAKSEDGIVMAIEHKTKPIYAVQFHPESIMTLDNDMGFKIIQNILKIVKTQKNRV